MRSYSGAEWERAMKREEILLRAYSKQIKWIEAAEVLGMSCQIPRDNVSVGSEASANCDFNRRKFVL